MVIGLFMTIMMITLNMQQQATLKWNSIKGYCNKIIKILIINGDIWQHNLQNTLSNQTAATIISIVARIIITDK